MAHRYWNADSDLDYYLGNAPPEEVLLRRLEEDDEPMEAQEESADPAIAATLRMIKAIDEVIGEKLPNYIGLRHMVRQICIDYGDARGAAAVRRCNEIWSRK